MKKVVPITCLLVPISTALCLFPVGVLELQIAYASPYMDIDVAAAYDMITSGSYPDLLVLDVRTQDDYDSEHIEGAVLIPHMELEVRLDELTDHKDHEVIVYCKSGGRSQIASELLEEHAFTKVYNMVGGIQEWRSAGYPTSKSTGTPDFWLRWWFWAIVGSMILILGALVYLRRRAYPRKKDLFSLPDTNEIEHRDK